MPNWRFFKISLIVSALLALSTLGACNDAGGSADETQGLTASDFGVPVGAGDDHEHSEEVADDHADAESDDHDHEQPEFDPSLTETGEEGVFIDHHGNRIVDELYQSTVKEDLKLEFTVENFLGVGGRGGEVTADIRAGERALMKFKISEVATEAPRTDLQPLAWLDLQQDGHFEGDEAAQEVFCRDKVEGYLSGMLTARPTADLNSFFIIALNDDPSISVIDPTVDVAGMTQLFALIRLAQPGEDWALSLDQERLFVTIPSTNQVAVTEMDGFDVAKHVGVGSNPTRIAFQPDQRYLWVGNDSFNEQESGVTVIDPETLKVEAFLPTGAGHHEFAFSADSRLVLVTNGQEGSLSVIDSQSLAVVGEIAVGRHPTAVAVSEANGDIYVADAEQGGILVIDVNTLATRTEIEAAPGLEALRFAPGGRWAFGANPSAGQIIVLDGSRDQVTHVAEVGGGPDQIAFSESAVYIRAREATAVYTLRLADLAAERELELATVPVGVLPPGQFPTLAVANGVTVAGKQGAVVIANPVDDQVYYLPEGATSPAGSFQGHTLRPRAVTVVDRSLQEAAPGVYTSRVRVPSAGTYLVALMLNDPLTVHCFEFEAKPNEALPAAALAPELAHINQDEIPQAGQPYSLHFSLSDPEDGSGVTGLTDIIVVANQVAGNWNARLVAEDLGEGVYKATFTPPSGGLHTVFFTIPSMGLVPDQLTKISLQVQAGG